MKRSGSASAQLCFVKGYLAKLLLVTAAAMAALYQTGCSGVTTAASKQDAIANINQFAPSASSLNLGNVALGDAKSVMLSFTNATNSAVTIMNISISGPGFSVSGIPSGTILNPGDIATLTVTFTATSTGSQSGSVTVTSNSSTASITVGLQALGVPAGEHLATLSWNASTSPVAGYFVYRSTTSGGPYTRLNTSEDTSLTYTDSSVAAGQSYYYVVTSVDYSNVESGYSNQVAATIPTP